MILIFIILLIPLHPTHFVQAQKELEEGEEPVSHFRVQWNTSDRHPQSANELSSPTAHHVNEIRSYTLQYLMENVCQLEKFKGLDIMRKKYRYYLSGFDEDGRPVWIAEWGKFDLRWATSGGGMRMEALDNFTRNAVYNMVRSFFTSPQGKSGRPTFELVFILDFEGFSMEQMTVASLAYLIKLGTTYLTLLVDFTHSIILINANYVAETMTNMFRPVLGHLMERVQVFGTNKVKWIPYLRRTLPVNQIPEWYGGAKDFKAVQVYG